MAKAKKKKRNKRTPQQLEKMRQKQREAMERNTLKNKKRIEEAIKKRKKNKQSFLNKKDMKNLQKVYANTSQKDVKRSTDLIYSNTVDYTSYTSSERVERIKRNENLPSEIRSQIDELINTQPFRKNECHLNAHQIAMDIEGVKKVSGFFSTPFDTNPHPMIKELKWDRETDTVSLCGLPIEDQLEKVGKGLYKMDDGDNLLDFINSRAVIKHSWNSYNGVHFDLTKNLNFRLKKQWMEYFESETIDVREDLKPQLTQSILDLSLKVPTKTKLLNANQIGSIKTDIPNALVNTLNTIAFE